MAKAVESDNAEIKKLLDAGKVVIGSERTLNNLKAGIAKKVFLSKNCSESTCYDVKRYAQQSGTDVVQLALTSEELGALCRRPFGISVLSVTKE